jgi:hypothetical protein
VVIHSSQHIVLALCPCLTFPLPCSTFWAHVSNYLYPSPSFRMWFGEIKSNTTSDNICILLLKSLHYFVKCKNVVVTFFFLSFFFEIGPHYAAQAPGLNFLSNCNCKCNRAHILRFLPFPKSFVFGTMTLTHRLLRDTYSNANSWVWEEPSFIIIKNNNS